MFRDIKKYNTLTERLAMIVSLIKNRQESEKLWKYFAEYDFYYVELKEREMVLESLKTLPNFQKMPVSFFVILEELTCRDNPILV